MKCSLLLAFTIGLLATTVRAEEPAVTDLDEVRMGEQVSGPRLVKEDLEGRVVVAYHWCVSCPMSTGAFPYVNGLVAKFRDRGLLTVGFQVRRVPEVAENDVVWYLEHLKPDFPVFRLGWNREWPSTYLGWAVVFDHEGNEVFAGNLRGIDAAIEKALDEAPDYQIGGPYVALTDLASRIVADRAHLGRHLSEARSLATEKTGEGKEAGTMLICAQRWLSFELARVRQVIPGAFERVEAYDRLANVLRGDPMADQATKRGDALRAGPTYPAEEAAGKALRNACVTFRRLPPPGGYIYHVTDMNYRNSEDPELIRLRVRMFAEFRLELDRIVATWPDTHAASIASDLLFEHDVPEIDAATAKARVERAERLLASKLPGEIHEAFLSLYEVMEGYLATDATSARAEELLKALRKDRAEELIAAAAAVRDLTREANAIRTQIRKGGSLLPRKSAEKHVVRLEAIAKKAGADSLLARRIGISIDALRKSYEGSPQLDFRITGRFAGPGLKIAVVTPDGAAAAAGLRPGDVVLKIAGKDVKNARAVGPILAKKKPEDVVTLTVKRASGEVETVELTLGRRP